MYSVSKFPRNTPEKIASADGGSLSVLPGSIVVHLQSIILSGKDVEMLPIFRMVKKLVRVGI